MNKYNKKIDLESLGGRRCITKCHKKKEVYVHPILLNAISQPNYDTCAINPIHSRDEDSVKYDNMIWIDKCNIADNEKSNLPDELESMLLGFHFNARDFLNSVYKLYSFDDVVQWSIDNSYLPHPTIIRVHNCAWQIYGTIDEISSSVIKYYYEIFQSKWLKKIISSFSFNIEYDQPVDTNNISNVEHSVDKAIVDLVTIDVFTTWVKKYVYEYEDKWDQINMHYVWFKRYICNQTIELLKSYQSK